MMNTLSLELINKVAAYPIVRNAKMDSFISSQMGECIILSDSLKKTRYFPKKPTN